MISAEFKTTAKEKENKMLKAILVIGALIGATILAIAFIPTLMP